MLTLCKRHCPAQSRSIFDEGIIVIEQGKPEILLVALQMGGAAGVRTKEVYFVTIQPKERLNMYVIPRA